MATTNSILTYIPFETNLGWMGIVFSSEGLRRVILPQKSKEKLLSIFKGMYHHGAKYNSDYTRELFKRLRLYLSGENVCFPDKLDLNCTTSFQQNVWKVTISIPYGDTRSYGWIANRINCKSPRAVGQALSKNPLPIIIPCHRVISSDGNLGGFSGGIEMKNHLLRLESSNI